MTMSDKSKTCCPRFNPKVWDKKSVVWKNKPFVQDEVRQIFHVPLGIGKVIMRMWEKIEAGKAKPKPKDFIMLAYDPSPWRSELYMSVTKDVKDAKMARLSGTFLTKVFEGPYNNVPKWMKEMDEYVKAKKKKIVKEYFYFTTCPKCAKKYGKNYVVAFYQVK
ncbi:hypothetical protein JW826_03430 [Candidatus Woesearchaeota archaeon]|nr:hypothetical protein [Candidatus Woesearchaeota archaeon]